MLPVLLDYINTLHIQYTKFLLDNNNVCVQALKTYKEENSNSELLTDFKTLLTETNNKINTLINQTPYNKNQLVQDYLTFIQNKILFSFESALTSDIQDIDDHYTMPLDCEVIKYMVECINKHFEDSLKFIGNILLIENNNYLDEYMTTMSDSALTITNNENDFICMNIDDSLRLLHLVPNVEEKLLDITKDEQGNRVVKIITETCDGDTEDYSTVVEKYGINTKIQNCGNGPIIVRQYEGNNLKLCMTLKSTLKNEYEEDVYPITSSGFPPLPGPIKGKAKTSAISFGSK